MNLFRHELFAPEWHESSLDSTPMDCIVDIVDIVDVQVDKVVDVVVVVHIELGASHGEARVDEKPDRAIMFLLMSMATL